MKRAELSFERPSEGEATNPPEDRGVPRDGVRLLVTTQDGHRHAVFRDLPQLLSPGTLLVVNRSATVPSSLPATGRIGTFRCNLSTDYGGGLWLVEPRRCPAEPGPLPLTAGENIEVAGLDATVIAPYPGLPRLRFVRITGDVNAAMNECGEPVRYAYLDPPFPPLEAYQTLFADVPGSAEMPSAARPFTSAVVDALHSRGIDLTGIVLHCGISSLEVETDEVENHPLYPEPFSIPEEAANAVNAARYEGRSIVAVGTTVVRAMESAWDGRRIRPRAGFTRRFVHPGRPAVTIDALLTGLHDPHASHLALLHAVAGSETIRSAYSEAARQGYLWHEFGDSHLIWPAHEPP